MTDICDGAEWTKMDVDDLKAGRSIEQAAQFSAAQIASTTSRANAQSWPKAEGLAPMISSLTHSGLASDIAVCPKSASSRRGSNV